MKKIIILSLISLFCVTAHAQQNITNIQYSIGFGTGDMNEYISKPSFRGFTIDYRKLIKPEIGFGFDIGWNVFYADLDDDVYNSGNLTLSGKQWRYSNHFPMLAAADYYWHGDKLTSFVGLGLGTMYSLQNTDMSVYTYERDAWHFTLRPEAGIMFKTASRTAFSATAKYYYGFEAGDLPAQGYVVLNFGMVFGL